MTARADASFLKEEGMRAYTEKLAKKKVDEEFKGAVQVRVRLNAALIGPKRAETWTRLLVTRSVNAMDYVV